MLGNLYWAFTQEEISFFSWTARPIAGHEFARVFHVITVATDTERVGEMVREIDAP
jgi:hypothetical protein